MDSERKLKKVSGRKRKNSFSVMREIRFLDKKRVVDFIQKGTGDGFLSFLKGFYNIEQEMPGSILEFLPTYSPDYNLLELV